MAPAYVPRHNHCMEDMSGPIRQDRLFTLKALENPTRLFHRIRAESPVTWVPELNAYLVTRHADIVAGMKDRRLANANMAQGLRRLSPAEQDELLPLRASLDMWMGHTNPADHVRFQQLLKRYFMPATVDALRPRVRELTHELLDAVAPQGRMDVVKDLAFPLPANVIAEMLGMPIRDRDLLHAWSRDIHTVFQIANLAQLRRCQRSLLEMQDYLRPLLAERRQQPREDVLSTFAAAEKDGLVTEDEIVANCVLLLFAGHETTAHLIANGLLLLFQNPEQLDLLKKKPELTPSAVEEMLRCDGPGGSVVRITTEPVVIGGVPIAAHQTIYLAMVAGNRDPEVFDEPDRFDVTRTPNRHTAFGMGASYCLGAALARMETDECFRILLDRFPDLRPVDATPDWHVNSPFQHHLNTLRVELTGRH